MVTNITTQTSPARLVLEGVPRVHFYEGGSRCPEDLTLPSVFRAILEFLGETDYGCKHCPQPDSNCKIHCTYSYLVGITGAGSFLSWKKGWEMDNVAIFYMSEDGGAPEQHLLDALGYNGKVIDKTGAAGEDALFRQEIKGKVKTA